MSAFLIKSLITSENILHILNAIDELVDLYKTKDEIGSISLL